MASQAVGIDIGSHAVKVAVLERKGATTKALRLFRATLAGDTDPARVQGAIQRGGIRGGKGLLGITGRDLIIRYTHVPPVPDWRLKLLMQFEINEVSGQSGGQVAADYRRLKLPVESDEETVLVALARNTWLQPRLAAARGAGFKVAGGCPNSVAIFNAFLARGGWKEGETTFLVSLGRENIDMAIQRDGELLFARNMSGGGHAFTEAIMNAFGLAEAKAEKNKVTKGDLTPRSKARYPDATAEKLANTMQGPAGQLVSMIQSSVMICRAQTKIADLNVDRLVLTGGTARMKGIVDYFQANMSVPVELFDPARELDLSALPAADQEEIGENAADFAAAVGLAQSMLEPTAYKLEVLTESEKRKRQFLGRTIWALGAAAAALALVVLLFKTRGDAIEEVRAANKGLEGIEAKYKKIGEWKVRTEAEELDRRQKEIALRVRRLPGAFTRAVLGTLRRSHVSKYVYLEKLDMEPEKRSFDLDGNPGDPQAQIGASEEAKRNIHAQKVWPVITVQGQLVEDTPNVGQVFADYVGELKRNLAGVTAEGWKIELKSTSPDRDRRFSLTFEIQAAKPAGGS
ncbi:MAG: pilus assembly protein PilM [Planctomycetes bacterium]|nr:pilus assembly protein PilM [Planctomycetota bacterium]